MATAYVFDIQTDTVSYTYIGNKLESNFGPHDPISNAKNLFTNLTMNENSKILKYNVEFWKLTAQLDWNESALVARYFSELPLRLRVEVMRGGKYVGCTPSQNSRCR